MMCTIVDNNIVEPSGLALRQRHAVLQIRGEGGRGGPRRRRRMLPPPATSSRRSGSTCPRRHPGQPLLTYVVAAAKD